MPKSLNLQCVFNNVSLGQIAYGVTNSLFNQNIDLNVFPIREQADISCFDKASETFKAKLSQSINKAAAQFDKNAPTLRIWHILESQSRISNPSYLLTFHECSSITDSERNILNSYKTIFVTSNYTKRVFEEGGVTSKVVFTPMGFDKTHFYNLNKKYYDPGIITFFINGKFEQCRKNHTQAITTLLRKFGNKHEFKIHLMVNNQFFKPEDMNSIYNQLFGGQKPPFNVVIIPHLQQNSLVNDAYNCADVIVDLGNEALSIPSLTCNGLGKFGVIHDCCAMSDWLPLTNSVRVPSNGMKVANDGIFFFQNSPYNQGSFFTVSDEDYSNALDLVVQKIKNGENNNKGRDLQNLYSYDNGVNIMLKEIYGE